MSNKVFGCETLESAACAGHLGVCKSLLENGASADGRAFIWAAERGHSEVCKLLLENGANVHADDDCALKYAANSGHSEVCKLLSEYGADLTIFSTEKMNLKRIVYKFASKEQIKRAREELAVQKVMSV